MWCIHRWTWTTYRHVGIFPTTDSPHPTKTFTEVYGVCEKCGEPRTKTIDGEWIP